MVLLGLIAGEILSRIGTGPLRLLSGRRMHSVPRIGLAYLLGLGTTGFCMLGLACAGLFDPVSITLSILVLFSACMRGWKGGMLIMGAAAKIPWKSPALLFLAAGAAAAHNYLVPVLNHDSYIYHLALPWQCMLVHKMVLSDIALTMHYPLPIDMAYTPALLLRDDRLVKIMVLFSFVAASAVFWGWCRSRQIRYAAWLGPLLAISYTYMATSVVEAKHDVPAAGLLIAGWLMWISGARVLGAALLGLSLAGKLAYLPTIAALIAAYRPRLAGTPLLLACLAAPVFPWFAKNYIATGAPFFPFLTAPFAVLDWGETNRAIFRTFLGYTDGSRLVTIAGTIAREAAANPALILAIPIGYFLRKGARKAILAAAAAMAVTIALVDIPRYWLPGVWLMALMAATAATCIPARYRKAAMGFLAALSLINAVYYFEPIPEKWRDVMLSRNAFLAKHLTTYEESIRRLTLEKEKRKVLAVGERLVYRLPARVIYGGQMGETPIIWKLVRESEREARLAVKIRQTGASHLLYNYISAEWVGMRYGGFPWDRRMARTYVGYCRGRQEFIWRSWKQNFSEGGAVLYRLRARPLFPRPARIWFAPGTEQVYSETTRLRERRKYFEFLAVARTGFKMMPDVGAAWNKMGTAYYLREDYKNAFKYFREFAEQGMLDESNLISYGIAAQKLGYREKAEALLEEVLVRSPDHGQLALKHLRENRLRGAVH